VVSIPLFDGISETLLEAMAAGCIPILSDIPPNRIIVPDSENAIFTRADSAQALAADIRMSLEQLDRLKETAVPANRKWVRENASIENAAGRLTDLLKRLVEK
jgi:glycosyltransferase involved in cell wall biosynthesis